MFITFEGLDFSGKTTQARLLVERLMRQPPSTGGSPLRVRFIREPGGTRISERLREILLDKKNLEMCDMAELMLFSASRSQLVAEIILPALHRGEVVVCDRYHDSTTVYQGYGRGLSLGDVQQVNTIATGGLDPDLTILIDIAVQEIGRRKTEAGFAYDRMESSGAAFYEKVRNGYLGLARQYPARIVCVDGMKTVGEVEKEAWKTVRERITSYQHSV
jgi:dTMP kinase